MRRFQSYGPSVVVAVAAMLTLLFGPSAVRNLQAARTAAMVTLAQDRLDDDDLLERINRATRDIAEAVEPSVVYIEAGDNRRDFSRSTGSGWVYDEFGHIVTNAHVVLDSNVVRVQFYDGRIRRADIVGLDRSTDIAVLRVEPDTSLLYPARRASGEPIHQGEMVFAFGSPFGFKFSMSKGIVSGLGRRAVTALARQGYTNYIQTDAAINPGNSGGPLVDVNGRVIGMNTAIITDRDRQASADTGVSGGIGFAIPLDTIESVVSQLVTDGIVLKGYLGVGLAEIDPALAEQAGFTEGEGVAITTVQEGQAADIAGIRESDIITHVNGERTPRMTTLRSRISNMRPGEKIVVTVWRNGNVIELPVIVGAARVDAVGDLRPVTPLAGSLTDAARKEAIAESLVRYGIGELEDTRYGVRVDSVLRGSAAVQSGFRPGLLITEIDGIPVRDRDALIDALAEARDNRAPVPVRVRYEDEEAVINLLLPD